MKLIKQLKDRKGRNMDLYLCKQNNKEFLFKEIKSDIIIEYELLMQKLARRLSVTTLKYLQKIKINNKKGILMSYLRNSVLLCNYKHNLNKKQKRELQRIILLDILVGNKDRHTANLFVNRNIIAFDHDKILKGKTRKSSAFIKLDVGKKLDKDYIEKVEDIIKKGNISTKTALLKYFGFNEDDILKIESDKEFRIIVDSLKLDKNEKERIIDFLIYRKNFNILF